MSTADRIRDKLTARFSPEILKIEDDSHQHQGHMGHDHGGETHFSVEIVSAVFSGLARVARQRLVYEALADELRGGVHALALRTFAPGEAR